MKLSFQWHDSIHEIPQADWDALALPLATPFLEWPWLAALEDSGCVHPKRGWQPLHLSVRHEDRLIGAAALYLKGHSRGEFVFDQEWAEASQQLNVPYYPKLLGMSPFTPAPGYRFLIAPHLDEAALSKAMLDQIDALCEANDLPGCHFLHTDPGWAETMVQAGMNPWLHHHLIWENEGLGCFDDYLAGFKAKQRKNIKRERRQVTEQGLHCRVIPGTEAGEDLYRLMFQLYGDTCEKFWNWSRYLNEDFFMRLHQTLGHRLAFAAAYNPSGGLPVAMSLLVHKGEMLHGRYWGCLDYFDQLHFEICYYQPIQWAIEQGMRYFDAGSGSAKHKKRRGFPARPNLSLHRHYHEEMRVLWAQNIDWLNRAEAQQIALINGTPIKPEDLFRNASEDCDSE